MGGRASEPKKIVGWWFHSLGYFSSISLKVCPWSGCNREACHAANPRDCWSATRVKTLPLQPLASLADCDPQVSGITWQPFLPPGERHERGTLCGLESQPKSITKGKRYQLHALPPPKWACGCFPPPPVLQQGAMTKTVRGCY